MTLDKDKETPDAVTHEGYVSKENFKTLFSMLLNDVAETNQ
jgi:hypothetical protein